MVLDTDCSWVGFFPDDSAQTQDDRTVLWLFSVQNSVWEVPSHNKRGVNNLPQIRGDEISQQMEQLGKVINQVTKLVQERVPFPFGEQIHKFVPRDQVWSRTGNTTPWPHIGTVHILLF